MYSLSWKDLLNLLLNISPLKTTRYRIFYLEINLSNLRLSEYFHSLLSFLFFFSILLDEKKDDLFQSAMKPATAEEKKAKGRDVINQLNRIMQDMQIQEEADEKEKEEQNIVQKESQFNTAVLFIMFL
jgi:hypothetical protein